VTTSTNTPLISERSLPGLIFILPYPFLFAGSSLMIGPRKIYAQLGSVRLKLYEG
jgi:hypothetical protein